MSDLSPAGAAAVRLAATAVRLRRERDHARDVAVALEQQVACLTAALNVALHYAKHPLESDTEALEGCAIALSDAVGVSA